MLLGRGVACGGLEPVPPVFRPLLLHPDCIMLTGMGFICVVACQFDVIESIERTVEIFPELQILHRGIRFQRHMFRRADQRLEMGLADEAAIITGLLQTLPDCGHVLRQLDPQCVSTVLARIQSGDERCACRCAGWIRTIGTVKAGALGGQPVQMGRFQTGGVGPQHAPMLLVAADEENVGAAHATWSKSVICPSF